jgi:hypothetical protein
MQWSMIHKASARNLKGPNDSLQWRSSNSFLFLLCHLPSSVTLAAFEESAPIIPVALFIRPMRKEISPRLWYFPSHAVTSTKRAVIYIPLPIVVK